MTSDNPRQDAADHDLDQLITEATGSHPAPDLAERIAARHRAAQAIDAQQRQAAVEEVQDVNEGFNNWWIAAAVALGMAVLGGVAWQQVLGDQGQDNHAHDGMGPRDQDTQSPTWDLYNPPQGIAHVHSGEELAALPADTRAIHAFDFRNRDMSFLARFTQLEWLDLSGRVQDARGIANPPPFDDRGLQHLAGLTNLKVLILDHCSNVLGEGLVHVAGLTGLQRLSLAWTHVDRQNLLPLGALGELRSLHLNGNHYAEGSSFAFLRKLQKLQFLNLNGCYQVPPEALKHLGTLRNLRSLDLGGVCGYFLGQTAAVFDDFDAGSGPSRPSMQRDGGDGVDDAVLLALKGLHQLEALNLSHCNITDRGIAHTGELPHLLELDISNLSEITSAVAASLPAGLKRLRCGMCPKLDDAFLKALAERIPGLQALDMRRNISPMLRVEHRFTQHGLLALLQGCKGIRYLDLSGNTQMAKTADNEPLRTRLGGVRTLRLDDNNTAVDWWLESHLPAFLPTSGEPPWLIEAVSVRNTDITDSKMAQLGVLPLRRLDVRGCKKITPASMTITGFLDLEVVALRNSGWEGAEDLQAPDDRWSGLRRHESAPIWGWNMWDR